jgi:hypothetical protein
MAIHTIPVPRGWSVEQAWSAIRVGQELPDPDPNWASIEVDVDDRLVRLVHFEKQRVSTAQLWMLVVLPGVLFAFVIGALLAELAR